MFKSDFTLPSFAKINWTLRVIGRRADGLHELQTIFQTVMLHDEIRFALSDDETFSFSCDAPEVPVDESNLIYRAALLLREFYKIKQGASVHLKKRIPVQGGLGGGSSNAAVALLGLARLWKLDLKVAELAKIGAHLGADVPFFLMGGTALGVGSGTELSPLPDIAQRYLLIVTPAVKISTAEAYKALNAAALTKSSEDIILSISHAVQQFADSFPQNLHNDFEPVIFRLQPEIERVKKALLMSGARRALLSGSGSSVFAIFDNEQARERFRRDALRAETSWRIFPCATLSRAQYFAALERVNNGPC